MSGEGSETAVGLLPAALGQGCPLRPRGRHRRRDHSVRTSSPGSFWNGDGISSSSARPARPRPPGPASCGSGPARDGRRRGGRRPRRSPPSTGRARDSSWPATSRPRSGLPDARRRRVRARGRVPWSTLGLTIPPARGTVIGMNLNVSDAERPGRLKAMLSSNPERVAQAQPHRSLADRPARDEGRSGARASRRARRHRCLSASGAATDGCVNDVEVAERLPRRCPRTT